MAPNVALLIETSNAYGRGIVQGISSYILEHGPWTICLVEWSRGEKAPSWLRHWKGSGILARLDSEPLLRAVQELDVAVVDLSTTELSHEFPCVQSDEAATVRVVYQHLVERGFQRFAYYSVPGVWWSKNRARYFQQQMEVDRREYHLFDVFSDRTKPVGYPEQQDQLIRWVAELPKPIGIMAGHDLSGHQVLNACRLAGISVPNDIAVVGVHNDELVCQLAAPPLSSVVPDTHRIGFEAASILGRMMHGKTVAERLLLVPPVGIETRLSSDILAIVDQDIADAIRYIREHACEGIRVLDVVSHFKLARRTFEMRFQKAFGHSPHDEILRLQLEHAKRLLAETDLKLSAVANRSGFRYHEYMTVVFKRRFGQTPSQFRAARTVLRR